MAEWKQAVNLAPRNYEWWAQYAQLCVDQKQYAEAGRAWVAAAQAAPDVQLREQYLTARGQIEQQRLDAEDRGAAQGRRGERAGNRPPESGGAQRTCDLEARVNTRPLSAKEAAKTVEWFDDSGSEKITGILMRVDCNGKQLRLSVKNDEGKTLSLLVPDTQQFEIKDGETLTCGAQKTRRVIVSYKPARSESKTGCRESGFGEATGMEFPR